MEEAKEKLNSAKANRRVKAHYRRLFNIAKRKLEAIQRERDAKEKKDTE